MEDRQLQVQKGGCPSQSPLFNSTLWDLDRLMLSNHKIIPKKIDFSLSTLTPKEFILADNPNNKLDLNTIKIHFQKNIIVQPVDINNHVTQDSLSTSPTTPEN